jgi:hypothetical protein
MALVGCPDEGCADDGTRVTLVGSEDPSLGTFTGPFTWLQTGEETTLEVTIAPKDEEATLRCGRARVEVAGTFVTADGVALGTATEDLVADARGVVEPDSIFLPLPASVVVEAGKVPEAPDILSRDPTAQLELSPIDGRYEATLRVRSQSDNLHVGFGTLTRSAPP